MDEHFGENRQCPVEWTGLKESCLTLERIARTHLEKRDCVEPGLEKRKQMKKRLLLWNHCYFAGTSCTKLWLNVCSCYSITKSIYITKSFCWAQSFFVQLCSSNLHCFSYLDLMGPYKCLYACTKEKTTQWWGVQSLEKRENKSELLLFCRGV